MAKYKIEIIEIYQSPEPNSYEQQRTVYQQTIHDLDVAKVVMAANESLSKEQAG